MLFVLRQWNLFGFKSHGHILVLYLASWHAVISKAVKHGYGRFWNHQTHKTE